MSGSLAAESSSTAIVRPDVPEHSMQLSTEKRCAPDGVALTGASSVQTLVVREHFRKRYPEVVYFLREAFEEGLLRASPKRTRCPLKGEARYWDVKVAGEWVRDAGWSYEDTLSFDPCSCL